MRILPLRANLVREIGELERAEMTEFLPDRLEDFELRIAELEELLLRVLDLALETEQIVAAVAHPAFPAVFLRRHEPVHVVERD